MRDTLILYGIAIVTFLAIDAIWLTNAGPRIYAQEIGSLLRDRPDFVVAFLFYLLFVAGLVVFVIQPAVLAGSVSAAVVKGAFFGLVAYATYDLTNLATIKGFTMRIALIDMAWGAILSGAVSWITYSIVKTFKLI